MKEENKLIALFMGGYKDWKSGTSARAKRRIRFEAPINGTYSFDPEELKYHSSWDWLMPVIERIEEMGFIFKYENHNIGTIWCSIWNESENNSHCLVTKSATLKEKIVCYWQTVIDFIQWYNQLNQTP